MSGRGRRQDGVMSFVFPPNVTSGVIGGLSRANYQFQVYATVVVEGEALQGERSPLDEDSMISVEGENLNPRARFCNTCI